MVYLLLEKGSMTAPELADYFEVSVRTIYRDIDILSSAGIPVYATRGKGGGISIQDNFVLKKSILSEQEQTQILMALQGIRIVEDEYTRTLLSKLSSVFQKQNVNWLEIDFSSWTKSGAGKDNFQKLQSAIFKSKIVAFHYYSGKGEVIKRVVEPLKLVFKSTDWYLYGYCSTRNDFRFFKLTRIRNLEITNDEYVRSIPEQIFVEEEKFEMELAIFFLGVIKWKSFHPKIFALKYLKEQKRFVKNIKHDTALQVMYGIIISTYQTQGVS